MSTTIDSMMTRESVCVTVSMTREVAEYYKQYIRSPQEWTHVVDKMLERYEVESLPPVEGEKYTQRQIVVTNPYFVSLYNEFGPKSKRCSLARLLKFGQSVDIFLDPEYLSVANKNYVISTIERKRAALTRAIKEITAVLAVPIEGHDKEESFVRDIKEFLSTYREMLFNDGEQ